LSLTKLHTNSTNKNLLKIQTRTSLKLEPKFESETVTIPKFEIRFLQNFFFLYNKNMTGHLGQYVDHSNWKISKIQISSSCGHFVEHWQREIKPNQFYCGCTVLVRSTPVAMLLGISTVDSSAPSPDPSQEERRGDEVCAQGPLPVTFFPA
jgi:hypothetical protein